MISQLLQADALLAANALLLGAAAIELMRVKRIVRRCRDARPAAATASEHTGRLLDGLDERLEALAQAVDELARRERTAERRPPPAAPVRVDAVRMAKNGATPEELARACGLNRGEAELLVRLHAARRA